jgi:osmotically-inducible protein OsmY
MTDKELKAHVECALEWEPSVDAANLAVTADNGTVTLRGDVKSYSEKMAGERAALRVFGVKGVANDILVHLGSAYERTDSDIAQAAVGALRWNTLLPPDHVTVVVDKGWLTLNGTLDWQYQKDAAYRAVRDLVGVKGVSNTIKLMPRVNTTDVRDRIEAAFQRSAELDARRISVVAESSKVTLSGTVRSWSERTEAERAAWAAPGVTHVDDRLAVIP